MGDKRSVPRADRSGSSVARSRGEKLKIRAIGHEGEAVEEDGRAPILSPGTSRHPRRRRRRCSTPIRVELCRRSPPLSLFRPLFALPSLSLFATHATLAGSLDPRPFEGRGRGGFPLFPFSGDGDVDALDFTQSRR